MNTLLINFTPTAPVETSVNKQVQKSKSDFKDVIKNKQNELNEEKDLKKKDKANELKSSNVSKNSNIKLEEIENKEADEIQDIDVINEEIILALIAEYLQIPIEQVQERLQELELEPIELLDQNQFMSFIRQVDEKSLELLLGNGDEFKKITELWSQLETMDTRVDNVKLELIKQKVTMENNGQSNNTIQLPIIQEIVAAEVMDPLSQVVRGVEVSTVDESTVPTGTLVGDTSMGLGIQIPVQAFNDAQDTRMWQNNVKDQIFESMEKSVDIKNQIISKLEITSLAQGKEIQMELDPKELGKLSFKMVEENGVFTAQIRVENEKTKELVSQNLAELKDSLEEQGITISKLEVDIREQSRQSQMNQERQKSSKRIEEIMAKHLSDIEAEVEQESEMARIDTEVDIMA